MSLTAQYADSQRKRRESDCFSRTLSRRLRRIGGRRLHPEELRQTYTTAYIEFRYGDSYRTARCKECGTTIPPNAPRVFQYYAFSPWTGNYCLSCVKDTLTRYRKRLADIHSTAKQEERLCRQLLDIIHSVEATDAYQHIQQMGKLLAQLQQR